MIPVADSAARFSATHWSIVLAAGDSASATARSALEALCQTYWPPLYAFARRVGKSPEDAKDLAQGFFTRLIEHNWASKADSEKGRFRTFLLTAFKRHMADADDHAHAQKRGGKCVFVPLDSSTEESRGSFIPMDRRTPETVFEERWAAALLDSVLARLREEFVLQGREALFDVLKGFLIGDCPPGGMVNLAARIGMSEGAARMILTRMRHRYRQILRTEISQTVNRPEDGEDELQHLYHVLTTPGSL